MRVWFEERKGEGIPWKPEGGRWSRWDDYFNSSKKYGEFSQDSNSVSVTVIETNDFYRLIEGRPRPVLLTWWLNGDNRISGQLIKSMTDSTFTDKMVEFEEWAKKNNPTELSYLMPEGNINPDGDRPERWKIILTAWRRDQGMPKIIDD